MNASRFAHLAQHLFNVPLMIHPAKAEIIYAALAQRLGLANVSLSRGLYDDDDGDVLFSAGRGRDRDDQGYDLIGPVARIPVIGTTVHKLGSLRPYSGMTGYDTIRHAIIAAAADDAVQGIMLDINSPGGEVSGCFDLVDTIYRIRQDKPIWAILSENAYSAGYAIASAADQIVVPRTGGTGSIGALWIHLDYSRALKEAGIKPTMVTKGAFKGQGRPEFSLSEEAFEHAQAEIDATGKIFDETVARNRGMSVKAVTATEAACFQGPKGVDIGLADAVMAPDAAFQAFLQSLS